MSLYAIGSMVTTVNKVSKATYLVLLSFVDKNFPKILTPKFLKIDLIEWQI